MLGPERQRAGELGIPGGKRLARPRIDQVEADARKRRLRGRERGEPFVDAVRPAEEHQGFVIERLQPERYAVDPGARDVGKARRLDRGGIGLERDLDIGLGRPISGRRIDDRRDRRGRHQRGRATAEEDRPETPSGQRRRLIRQVGEQSVAPRRLVDALADMAVEIAIGAFRDAERPMDIKRERRR